MKKAKQKRLVDFSEIVKTQSSEKYKNISEILNKEIMVTEIRFGENDFGRYVAFKTRNGEWFRTYSKVLLQKFAYIDSYMNDFKDEIEGVKLKIVKRKRYYDIV